MDSHNIYKAHYQKAYMKPFWLVVCMLFLFTACTSQPTPLEEKGFEHCGMVLQNDDKNQQSAHCFYDALTSCEPKTMDLAVGKSDDPLTTARFYIVESKGEDCILRMEVLESKANGSGVALPEMADPHAGSFVECPYKKAKPQRNTNMDYDYAIHLGQGMYAKYEKNACTGPLVQLWKNDEIRHDAFVQAIASLKESDCNPIVEERYREECKTTIRAIVQEELSLCEELSDIDMKMVCMLRLASLS